MSGLFLLMFPSKRQSKSVWTDNIVVIQIISQQYLKKTLDKMLKLCVCDNTFVFNGKIYKQTNGVAMGSSLGPLLANIYMAHLEEEFFLKNALDYSPTFYRRYVDDTFCLFKEKDHIKRFMNFMNGIDAAIQFDMGLEHQDKLSFLDTSIKRNVNNLLIG